MNATEKAFLLTLKVIETHLARACIVYSGAVPESEDDDHMIERICGALVARHCFRAEQTELIGEYLNAIETAFDEELERLQSS